MSSMKTKIIIEHEHYKSCEYNKLRRDLQSKKKELRIVWTADRRSQWTKWFQNIIKFVNT